MKLVQTQKVIISIYKIKYNLQF